MGILNDLLAIAATSLFYNPIDILEIGPGYGVTPFILNRFGVHFNYTSIDVNPKIATAIPCNGNGDIPDEIKNKKFNICIAHNVFQHLSIKQRLNYYKNINSLLNIGSLFILSLPCLPKENLIKHNNKQYICHYGQFTELQLANDVIKDVFEQSNEQMRMSFFCDRSDYFASIKFRKVYE